MKVGQKLLVIAAFFMLIFSGLLANVAQADTTNSPYIIGLTIRENNGSDGNSGSDSNSGNSGNSGESGNSGTSANEEDDSFDVQKKDPTNDIDEIYDRYKDNSFSLMNVEYESLNPINTFLQNANSWIKNVTFSIVVMIGKFNAELTHILFSIDIAKDVKEPFQDMALSLGKKMNKGAMTVGIVIIALAMILRFTASGRMVEAFKVFGLALLVGISFATFNSPKGSEFFFDSVLEVDHQIENMVAGVNPQFQPNEDTSQTVAEKVRSEVFYSNVYQPYLYMNYGTNDTKEITKKTVEYGGEQYDRIGALLDNDGASKKQVKFVQKVTDYEADKLNNSIISYTNSLALTGFNVLYIITNGIQTVVFFILGMLRIALQLLLIIVPVFLPIALFLAMCFVDSGILSGYFKGLFSLSLIKSGVSLFTLIFVSYIALGYKTIQSSDSIIKSVITIIAWILAPLTIYVFRYLLASVFSSRARLLSGGMINAAFHPFQSAKRANNQREKERSQREKDRDRKRKEFEKKKKAQEESGGKNPTNELNSPKQTKTNKKNTARFDRLSKAGNDTEANSPGTDENENGLGSGKNANQNAENKDAKNQRLRKRKEVAEAQKNSTNREDQTSGHQSVGKGDDSEELNRQRLRQVKRPTLETTEDTENRSESGSSNELKKGNIPKNQSENDQEARQKHAQKVSNEKTESNSIKSVANPRNQQREKNERVERAKQRNSDSRSSHPKDTNKLNKTPQTPGNTSNKKEARVHDVGQRNGVKYNKEIGEILPKNERIGSNKRQISLNKKLQTQTKGLRKGREQEPKAEKISSKQNRVNKIRMPIKKQKRK